MAEERRARRRWTLIIVGFLVVDIGAAAVLILAARGDPSHHVEQDYYNKALAWDETMADRRRAQALGWKVNVGLLAAADPRQQLVGVEVDVRDRRGEPVAGATVKMTGFHKARASQRVVRTLAPAGRGRHRGVIRRPRPGTWALSFEVSRGADRLTTTVERTIELGVAPPAGNK